MNEVLAGLTFDRSVGLKGSPMWAWLMGGYAVLLFVLIGTASYVALFVPDAARRADAYRVLKLVLAAATGASGVLAGIVKLRQTGLL